MPMRKETILFIIATFGSILSILFCIGMVIYMVIAQDLSKVVTNQQYYIRELEWEVEQTEMICSNVEVNNEY